MKKCIRNIKTKYILLTRYNNSYKITEVDKLINESSDSENDENDENNENNNDSKTPDWLSISNRVRPSVVQVYSIQYEINPKYPYILPYDELARGSGFIIHSSED